MSGGVGPCDDISLPRENDQPQSSPAQRTGPTAKSAGFLSFRQLNALSVIVVLSASGMVAPQDLAFVILSLFYIYFLSVVAFPSLGPSEPTVFDPKNRILRIYVLFAALVGLILPIAYIFQGIYAGDKEGIKAATPHLFLLASQVFMEGVAFSGLFSTPIRVFVPVAYNTRRIFTLMDWLRSEFGKVETAVTEGGVGGGGGASASTARRLSVGRALALANMALWCFNLFGFLLPVYLPRAFKKYYSGLGNRVKDCGVSQKRIDRE